MPLCSTHVVKGTATVWILILKTKANTMPIGLA